MPAKPRLFISYARKDGRDLALRLQADLADSHEVWLDTSEIEGGASWSVAIEGAIDGCAVGLALLSAGSFASEICRAEQLRLLRLGKRVIPLLVQPGAERPLHLESLNYRDFSDPARYADTLAVLRADLAGASAEFAPPPPTPTNADPLPHDYVERPGLMHAIRAAVLDDSTDRRVALTALHGLGGIGKSVLASALCHDPVVRDAYPDGVIWLKIGQNPGSLVEQMRIVGHTLGDDLTAYQSANEAESALRTLLPRKSALIVLDDVWHAVHVLPFISEAPRSRVLFTTRNRDIADHGMVRAAVVSVSAMQPGEAVELLERASGQRDPALATIAREVGYHPLALSLAGGRIRADLTPAAWLAQYQQMRTAVIKAGRRADERHDNIEVCFNLSIEALHADDRPLYHTLGIFAEDLWFPRAAVIALWREMGLSDYDAGELLQQVIALSLVEQRADDGALALHDLLHDYNLNRLGDGVGAAHARLITAWGDPFALPDPYAWGQYGYHLIESGQGDRLFALLFDLRWLQGKLGATNVPALLAECDRLLNASPTPERAVSVRLLRQVFTLSAPALSADPRGLASQIAARTLSVTDPAILTLRAAAAAAPPAPLTLIAAHPPLAQAGGNLLAVMVGHTGSVSGALALDDGSLLSWSSDGTLRRWNRDGATLSIMIGHSDSVNGALALDDGTLLSWSRDNTLRRWSRGGATLAIMTVHSESLSGALMLNDGTLLSWSKDKTLRRWSRDGVALAIMSGHSGPVNGALEMDDGTLLSWSKDKTLRRWSRDGATLTVMIGHSDEVNGALALDDGTLLSWSDDGTLRRWSRDGATLAVVTGHSTSVYGALALGDGTLLSWSGDGTLRRWSRDGETLAVMTGHTRFVNGALALDDGTLLSWSGDGTLRRWSRNGTRLAVMTSHSTSVYGALALDDGTLLSWSGDKTLRQWNRDGTVLAVMTGHAMSVNGALALEDGTLLSWSGDKTLRRWNRDESESAGESNGHTGLIIGILVLNDGTLLSWSFDKTLRWWSRDERMLAVMIGHSDFVWGALALDDETLLSWSRDGTLRRWSRDGMALAAMTGHSKWVQGALALDDGTLVSWSMDATLRRWSRDGTELAVMTGHSQSVTGALALDDKTLLSWSDDNTLRHWSRDGVVLAVMTGHARSVAGALALDDGTLLSWSHDGTLRRWSREGVRLAVMTGHSKPVDGALALEDGTLLSWSNDDTLRRWGRDGTALGQLDEPLHGDWTRIAAWAGEQGFDPGLLFEAKNYGMDEGLSVKRTSTGIEIYDVASGATWATFASDHPITAMAVSDDTIAAGDQSGRMIFLRWTPPDQASDSPPST